MRILYFAWLREKIGLAEEDLAVPAEVRTVRGLVEWLLTRDPRYRAGFAQLKLVRCAVDQEFVTLDAALAGATEVAFFPPVTGG